MPWQTDRKGAKGGTRANISLNERVVKTGKKGAKGRRGEGAKGRRGELGRTRANISFKERVVKTSRKGAKGRTMANFCSFSPFSLFVGKRGEGAN